jgi:hypothetical protein
MKITLNLNDDFFQAAMNLSPDMTLKLLLSMLYKRT